MRKEVRCGRSSRPVSVLHLNDPAESTGCNVAINYANSTQRANDLVQELQAQYPALKITAIQADVGQKTACEHLIEEAISRLQGLDVVISNAGSEFQTQFHRG